MGLLACRGDRGITLRVLLGCAIAAAALLCAPRRAAAVNAVFEVDNDSVTINDQTYTTAANDTSGIYATNFSTLTVYNSTVTTSGSASSLQNSANYGFNAVALADSSSTLVMSGGKLASTGSGANGAFASTGGRIFLSNVEIGGTSLGAGALAVSLGGFISAVDVTALNSGGAANLISGANGGGTIVVSGGSYTANGLASVGIYALGSVTATGTSITANNGEAAMVYGNSSAALYDSALAGAVGANDRGVLLYNTSSARAGTARFFMSGGSLLWPSAAGPMIQASNQDAEVSLSTVAVTNSSPVLAKAIAVSGWGTSGSNGSDLVINASSQALAGALYTDAISTITLNLRNASSFTGTASTASVYSDATSTVAIAGSSFFGELVSSGPVVMQAPAGAVTDGASYSTVTARSLWLGGLLQVNAYLAGDATQTDRFVVNGGPVGGAALVRLNVTGHTGAATTGSGIKLVDLTGGAVTSTYAFTLEGGHVCNDGACYRLVRGGLTADPETNNDWFLRTSLSTFTVTGVVRHNGNPLSGVAINLDGDEIHSMTTAADGAYSFELSSGAYTVTPVRSGYAFSPSYRVISSSFDVTGQDFSAYLATRAVSGVITYAGSGLAGVTITASGTSIGTAVTAADGSYSIMVGTGVCTITPTLTGFAFTPASFTLPASWNPSSGHNFAGERTVRYALSGAITAGGSGVPGVTVALTGYTTGTYTTGASGTYTFSLPPGHYTVTPTRAGYLFTPVLRNVSLYSDVPGQDFSGYTPLEPIVKGGPYGYAQPNDGYPAIIILPSAPATGRVTVRVFTQRGARLVRKLEKDVTAGVPAQLTWDCLNEDGRAAGSGIYVAVITGGGFDNIKLRIGVLR